MADIQVTDELRAKRMEKLRDVAGKFAGKALIAYPGARSITPAKMLESAAKLRDTQIMQYPILPEAITIFQQLASNREWKVSGPPRAASRAVEWFNNAQVQSPSGYIYRGMEGFFKRRSADWLIVGRTAMAVRKGADSPLEYIDPTELRFKRKKSGSTNVDAAISPVSPSEQVWRYIIDGSEIRASELFIDHPIPLGGRDLFISPIAPVLPTATLSWLLREFDTAALDGRRLRDIIITSNNGLSDALEEAILEVINVYAGADPSDIGIQVVTLNGGNGVAVKDMVYRLGLANIPEAFDRKDFRFGYVNEISAALGLALRQFWNEEVTTNKALEEVQEARQQSKGPAAFVRSEQRNINNSGMLKRFGKNVRFGFVEEVDSSSQLINAQVLKLTADALSSISTVFGGTISLEGYLAWMQSINMLPAELEIVTAGQAPQAAPPKQDVLSSDPSQVNAPGETTVSSDPTASPLNGAKDWLEKALDYEEVSINQDGVIIERRNKVFSVLKAILTQKAEATTIPEADFDQSLSQARSEALDKLKHWIEFEHECLENRINTSKLYEPSKLLALCNSGKIAAPELLTEEDHAMITVINELVMAGVQENDRLAATA